MNPGPSCPPSTTRTTGDLPASSSMGEAGLLSRSVPEWIGKTPDAKVPPRVRLRVLERYERRCYLSGRPIAEGDRWEVEHIVALCNGGQHRETNLAPALAEPHRVKTRADVRQKSLNYKRRLSAAGLKKSKRPFRGWRKFNGEQVWNPKA